MHPVEIGLRVAEMNPGLLGRMEKGRWKTVGPEQACRPDGSGEVPEVVSLEIGKESSGAIKSGEFSG
jgi:hypothetical protein